MMYNGKNSHTPTKKLQEKKVHHVKKSPADKFSDKNDHSDKMVLKNFKSKMNSPEPVLTPDKGKDSKLSEHSNFLTNNEQSADKHCEKRKDEKNSPSPQKKLKNDNTQSDLSSPAESVPPKKVNKFKSMFPKTYICKYCCRRFHSVEQLKQHTNAEHANKPSHVCHLCSHQAASFSALMTHYLKHSGNKRDNVEKIYAKSKADFSNIQFNIFSRPKSAVQCNKCNLSFSSKPKYDAHNCSNIPQKSEYNCAYCRHISTTVEDYRNHIQSHSETPFSCPYCKHKAMTKKQFDSHRESCKARLKSNVNFECDKCNNFSTKNKKEFNDHSKTCGIVISQTCTKCGEEFKEEKSYEEHVLICHKNDKQVIKAKKNNNNNQKPAKRTFKRKRKSKESVSDKNKLLCCVCDHICSSKSEHEEHERQCLAEMANDSNNSSNKIKTIVCTTCGETIEENKLAEHNAICQNKSDVKLEEKPINDGPKKGRRGRRPNRRKSSITDDEEIKKPKPIKIKIPRKPKIPKLLMKPKFRKGRQSKNANNPFLCNYCDFTFCSKSTLLRHKRMHSGNPWYVCQYCGKFFFRKDVYIRHEMNVHKNSSKNMFCCYYCKLCFSETLTLREHVEAAHKKSAFLPIKNNVSEIEDEITPVKKRTSIKKEKNTDNVDMIKTDTSTEVKKEPFVNNNCQIENDSPTYSKFKCSECFEFFENASSIEIHMQTHAKLQLNTKNAETFVSATDTDMQKQITTADETNVQPEFASTVSKFNELEEKGSDASKLSTVPYQKSLDSISDNFGDDGTLKTSQNKFSDVDKLDSDANIITPEPLVSLKCKLCLKHFSSRKLWAEHCNIVHKIVDWYQCLVCPASGPKKEILEHMLTHMYKVGSFVVADIEDYDAIISSIQNDELKKTGENSKKQSTNTSNDNSLITEDKLPPLKEYGLCSCFDNKSEQIQEDYCSSPLETSNVVDFEQSKDMATLECFETTLDLSTKNEERKISINTSINSSVENSSSNLSAQNVNNPCDNVFHEEVPKIEEIEEDHKGSSQTEDETETETSSPIKQDFPSDLKSVENSLDYNPTESFSQLRYLLQSPNSKHSIENKTPLYSFPHLQNPNDPFSRQNSSLKSTSQDSCSMEPTNLISKNDGTFGSLDLSSKNNSNFTTFDLSSKNNIDFVASDLLTKSDINVLSSKQNFVVSNENRDKTSTAQEKNQSSNTCLKFDVNQSRCEFSENVNYARNLSISNQKIQNPSEVEKSENFFKTCPTPNAILDFSDLIQHSFENSSPSEDNIFSYSLPKQADTPLNISMREEVRTPDCSDMISYDCSEYDSSLKCQKCNVLLLDDNDKLNHKCSYVQPEQSVNIDLFSPYKPKNTFYSLANVENQNKNVSLDTSPVKKDKILTPEKQASIFICSVCTKVVSSEIELVKHQKVDHGQTFQNSPQTCECTKCHRTFPVIGELMKHSLTCLRTLFLKSTLVNDCLNPTNSLQQTLMKKEEPKTNFAVNSPFSSIPTDFSRQNSESLLKRSFNS